MRVKILGCGNAFSTENGNNCILLEEFDSDSGQKRRMLIDAGWDLPHMLKRNDIDIKSIDDIYISHLHADHIGGLEYVAYSRYDWINKPEHYYNNVPELPNDTRFNWTIYKHSDYAPNLIGDEKLLKELWSGSLYNGLSSIEGFCTTLDTFFCPYPIKPNQTFNWQGWTCKMIQQIHIMAGSIITPSFGLYMSKEGHKSIYFVTDSQHCSPRQLELFYKSADIIIQDCELTPFYSNVHANYEQLAGYEKANSVKLSAEIKAKMWLTHYQDFYNNEKDFFGKECDWDSRARIDGFAGFVKVGQEFEI
jgi:ribonuclease BN (tRNA processing enzyme)